MSHGKLRFRTHCGLDLKRIDMYMLLRIVILAAIALCSDAAAAHAQAAGTLLSAPVLANDNRTPGGTLRDGVLRLNLEARLAAWRPDAAVDSAVTVQAFAEDGGAPRIPGPLLRTIAGTEVAVTVRNSLPDSTLVVYGLRAGAGADDTLHVAPGAVREVRYRAGAPGTYLYWGRTTESPINDRPWRDSQLTGAIVIDPPGAVPDAAERIFVMTVLDLYPSDTVRNRAGNDVFDRAINGLSWPHTERLEYAVGDTVRWRWINGSYLPHPMHLHGFHFRVLARGDGYTDSTYAAAAAPEAVTEFMLPGATFRMEWVPTREGTWLMHCHMVPHITPFPARPDSLRGHDMHDVEGHALRGMAGLVMGITTVDRSGADRLLPPAPTRRLRLFAQESGTGKATRRGYVVQRAGEPARDSVEVPGSPLVLTRGETVAITVLNRLAEPTTVHWHGMELDAVFDGVSGWSRTGSSVAPLLAPGDSFTVVITPPRAGTFIYHTHMDEGGQLPHGMYGPLLVLEPGETFRPETDLVFTIGGALADTVIGPALNGSHEPPVLELRAGTTYRLRFINILSAALVRVELVADSVPVTWRALAKDGADLTAAVRRQEPAALRSLGVGETYDFEWTPAHPVDAELVIHVEGQTLRQPIRVRH